MLGKLLHRWLTREVDKPIHNNLFDFNKVIDNAQPADVWLFEGHTRLSRVISVITRSPWTHAALYIGKPKEIFSQKNYQKIQAHYQGNLEEPVLIESLMGKGIIITPVSFYQKQNKHVRVCRPMGLRSSDAKKILRYAIQRLGDAYDALEVFDLARFLYPWHILPRRWHSSLFSYKPGTATKMTCSHLLADAFESVDFPILPALRQNHHHRELILRNPKLFTPRDFDYSPFFEILKYPFIELSKSHSYHHLLWNHDLLSNDDGGFIKKT